MCEKCELIKQAAAERLDEAPATPMARRMFMLGRVLGAFGHDLSKATGSTITQAEVVGAVGSFFVDMISNAPKVVNDASTPEEVSAMGDKLFLKLGEVLVDVAARSGVTRDLLEPPMHHVIHRLGEDVQEWIAAAAFYAEMQAMTPMTHDEAIALFCRRAAHMLSVEIEKAKSYEPSDLEKRVAEIVAEDARKREKNPTLAGFAGVASEALN